MNKDGKLFDKTFHPDQELEANQQIMAMLGWKINANWAQRLDRAIELIRTNEYVHYNLFSENWGDDSVTCELYEMGGSEGDDPVNVQSGHGPTAALAVCAAVLAWEAFRNERIKESEGKE